MHEIFRSIQGESTYSGKPCIFVRLAGCNLNCSYCLVGNTKILTPFNKCRKGIKIKDLKKGDKVFSFNEKNKKIEIDTIKKTFCREVNEVLKITFKNGCNQNDRIYTTSEHPFYVEGKWITAGNLKINDELWFAESVKIEKIKKGRARLFGKDNPNWRGGIEQAKYTHCHKEWKILREKILKRDNSTCKKCKAKEDLVVHHIDFNTSHNTEDNLCVLCRKCNSSINHGRYDFKIHNGKQIIKIEKISIDSNKKAYIRLSGSQNKKIKVYNIETKKNNNYFAPRVLVHNCDTKYSVRTSQGKIKSVRQVFSEVKALYKDGDIVEITGGEPMLQKKEMLELSRKIINKLSANVLIETNGSILLERISEEPYNIIYIMDWKCPSSGMNDKMEYVNLERLTEFDELKFVIGTQEDYDEMKRIITKYNPRCTILASTVWNKIKREDVVKQILADGLNVTFQVQIHKIIWDKNKRGV